jgi:hypothetical protein
MFNISSNGIVTVNRGDSFEFPVLLQLGNSMSPLTYQLQDKDKVYIGIMEPNQPFEDALIKKVCTAADQDMYGYVVAQFQPLDTLYVLPGKYYYQIKLQTINQRTGQYDTETMVDKTLFYIQE